MISSLLHRVYSRDKFEHHLLEDAQNEIYMLIQINPFNYKSNRSNHVLHVPTNKTDKSTCVRVNCFFKERTVRVLSIILNFFYWRRESIQFIREIESENLTIVWFKRKLVGNPETTIRPQLETDTHTKKAQPDKQISPT